jgi:hypothetical protein
VANPVELSNHKGIEFANVGSHSIELGIALAGPSAPPVVSNIVPATGSALQPTSPIAFQVTSPANNAFRSIIILAQYPVLGMYEVVHDGLNFSANYTGSRTAIAGGFQYANILRIGGWPASPTFIPNAVDVTGQENP